MLLICTNDSLYIELIKHRYPMSYKSYLYHQEDQMQFLVLNPSTDIAIMNIKENDEINLDILKNNLEILKEICDKNIYSVINIADDFCNSNLHIQKLIKTYLLKD